MSEIAYTVTCTVTYKTLEQDWLDWIGGHMDEVVAAGAQSAELIKRDHETDAQVETVYEIRYKFKDRGSFDEYLENHAPRLRRDSHEKFPVEDGFHYQRNVGEVLK